MVLHPRFVFGAIEPAAYEAYKVKNRVRSRLSYKAMSEMMINNSLVKVKEAPPYTKDLEGPVLLNSLARTVLDPKTGSYAYPSELATKPVLDAANVAAVSEILSNSSTSGIGVDQGSLWPIVVIGTDLTDFAELISSVPSNNPTFISRNFTNAEVDYCRSQPSPQSSFAARWAGKEAVFKSLGVSSKGAAAAMRDIEILPNGDGVPTVTLHGDAKRAAESKGIIQVHISLSHSEVSSIVMCSFVCVLMAIIDCRHRIRSSLFCVIRFTTYLLFCCRGFYSITVMMLTRLRCLIAAILVLK